MSNVISFKINNQQPNIQGNISPALNNEVIVPKIKSTAYVHSLAAVIGNVYLGERVMVAPGASVRGDEYQPIWVGNDTNVQDNVVLHALETYDQDTLVEETVVEVDGNYYGIYIDDCVSLTPQCQIYGPASIGAGTFVGMQSLVFRATVGKNCVIEPKALVMGVDITDDRYVPAGALITTQAAADSLPLISQGYPLKNLSRVAAEVNAKLAAGSQKSKTRTRPRVA